MSNYTRHLSDVDDARRMPKFQRAPMLAEQSRVLQREARRVFESEADSRRPATAAGDHRKLRGIPAIARGVSGVIPGTQPEQAATR